MGNRDQREAARGRKGIWNFRKECLKDDGTRINGHRDFGENIGDEADDGEDPTGGRIEALLEKLRNGKDARAVIKWDKDPGQ